VDLYLHSPDTPSWRSAQLKRKVQGQLYLYLYLWVAPRAGLDAVTERKVSAPTGSVSPVLLLLVQIINVISIGADGRAGKR
jgi:hypothetical protein